MPTDGGAGQERLNVGLLLFIPYRSMEARVFRALAAAGYDVTPAQGRILQRVGPHGTRLGVLAEAAQVTKQTASFLVEQLERNGYVRRTPDPADARARLVQLADRALAAQRVAEAIVAEVEAEWRAHVGSRQWAQLQATLTRLREITDPYQ